jgi:hypothetical protein
MLGYENELKKNGYTFLSLWKCEMMHYLHSGNAFKPYLILENLFKAKVKYVLFNKITGQR